MYKWSFYGPIVSSVYIDAYACGGWLTEIIVTDYSYVVLPKNTVSLPQTLTISSSQNLPPLQCS